MIEPSELSLLTDERHSTRPEVIPNGTQRQILRAARLGQLCRTDSRRVFIKGHSYRSAVNAVALEQCYFHKWIKNVGEHEIELTAAGVAAEARRRR